MKYMLMKLPVSKWRADPVLHTYIKEAMQILQKSPKGVYGHDAKALRNVASTLVISQLSRRQ
jgi:hypothetical protein